MARRNKIGNFRRYYQVTPGGVNEDVTTRRGRTSSGKFVRLYNGNFKSRQEAIAAKAGKGQKFGNRHARYRQIRHAFGLVAG